MSNNPEPSWLPVGDHDRYHYRVHGNPEYADFGATCDEFSLDIEFAATPHEALDAMRRAVAGSIEEMARVGLPIPQRQHVREFSEPLDVRVTSGLHRKLIHAAVRNGVNMEQLVNDRLTAYEELTAIVAELTARITQLEA